MSVQSQARVTVLFDSSCCFCQVFMAAFLLWDRQGHVYPIPIQSRAGEQFLAAMPQSKRLASAHLVDSNGTVLSGGEAAPTLFRQLPGGRYVAAGLAAAMPLTRLFYGFLTWLRPIIGPLLPRSWCARGESRIAVHARGTMPPTALR